MCGAVRSACGPWSPLSRGLTAGLSARVRASYLAERSAKRSRAGEGGNAKLPSPLTWSRGSSLTDSVSRIHGSGAGNTSREGGRAKGRGQWESLDRRFLIARYSRSDPVNSRRGVQDTELRLHYERSLTPARFLRRIRLASLLEDTILS